VASAREPDEDEIRASLEDEIGSSADRRGRWYAEYLGLEYRHAVDAALSRAGGAAPRVLKTDLWNECVAGDRDIANHLAESVGCRLFAVELSLALCVRGRDRAPGAAVVRADIRALPFRTGSFDAVLDLSTLDHLSEEGAARAVGEYERVLRPAGALLLVYWQRGALLRLRLLLKRWLGRPERSGQRYFRPGDVRDWVEKGAAAAWEVPVGSLLLPPHRLTRAVLGRIPAGACTAILRATVSVERWRFARRLLAPITGMRAVLAVRNPS